MSIQSVRVVCMCDDDQIAIIIGPQTVDRICIRASKYDNSVTRGVDRCTEFVQKLDAMMRITCPVGSGGIGIGRINGCIRRRLDRPLEYKVPVGDAVVHLGRIANFGSGSLCWRNRGASCGLDEYRRC